MVKEKDRKKQRAGDLPTSKRVYQPRRLYKTPKVDLGELVVNENYKE